jgi:hypothetical protein
MDDAPSGSLSLTVQLDRYDLTLARELKSLLCLLPGALKIELVLHPEDGNDAVLGLCFDGSDRPLVAGLPSPRLPTELLVVLSTAAGYVGKKAVDVISDVIKTRLMKEKLSRTVNIYGGDGSLIKSVIVDKPKD